jgi:hypothetical protein
MKQEIIIKLIEMLFQDEDTKSSATGYTVDDMFLGQYAICRSRNEGVNFGKVARISGGGILLKEAQRLHYFAPIDKNLSWYEGVAASGISSDSRISTQSTKLITEDYSLTLCSDICVTSIKGHKSHEQK